MDEPELQAGWQLLEGLQFRETTELPKTEPPFIAASAYIATLAYPNDVNERNGFIAAAKALGAYHLRKGGRRYVRAQMRPRNIQRYWRRTENRIEQRLMADDAARILLMARVSKGTFISVPGVENLRHATGYVLQRNGIGLPEGWHETDDATDHRFKNFIARVWAPSKPVLQLAWGLYSVVAGKRYRLDELLFRPDWVTGAINGTPTRVRALVDSGIVKAEETVILRFAVGPKLKLEGSALPS